MLNRLRIYLSRMFIPYLYTPEGFRVTQEKYIALEDTTDVPADQKRTITVCNLFANQQMAIDEIAKLLDTNRRIVVSALLHEGLILDRRDSEWTPTVERRHAVNYHLPRVVSAGADKFRSLCGQFGSETVSEFVFYNVLKKEERCEECRKKGRLSFERSDHNPADAGQSS